MKVYALYEDYSYFDELGDLIQHEVLMGVFYNEAAASKYAVAVCSHDWHITEYEVKGELK